MDFFAELAARNAAAFVLVLFGGQIIAREIGFWFGRRHANDSAPSTEGVGVVVGSMLGLLAFVLALTLSSSTSRFQERRQSMLAEANAISSAWARAQAVGDVRGQEIARHLTEYTQTRIEFVEAPPDAERLADIDRRSAALQGAMQHKAAAMAQAQPNPLTVSLLNDLDAAFGAATTVRFAFTTRMLPQLFWLLLGMTLVAVAGLGYQMGVRGNRLRMFSLLIIGMWTAVIAEILDLGTARIGTISNDAIMYRWLQEEFALDQSMGAKLRDGNIEPAASR